MKPVENLSIVDYYAFAKTPLLRGSSVFWNSLDSVWHGLGWLGETNFGPEEGKDDSALHVAKFRDVFVSADDKVELKLWLDGQGEPELRYNVHVELVLFFTGAQPVDRLHET